MVHVSGDVHISIVALLLSAALEINIVLIFHQPFVLMCRTRLSLRCHRPGRRHVRRVCDRLVNSVAVLDAYPAHDMAMTGCAPDDSARSV